MCNVSFGVARPLAVAPPSIQATINRQIGQGATMFASFVSGNFEWPVFLSNALSSIIKLGRSMDSKSKARPGSSQLTIGVRVGSRAKNFLSKGPLENADYTLKATAYAYGGHLGLTYARDLFSAMPEWPLRSVWTKAGEIVTRDVNAPPVGMARNISIEVDFGVSTDLSVNWTVRGSRMINNFSNVGLAATVNPRRGLVFSLSWNRLGQAIELPIFLAPTEFISAKQLFWTVALPWMGYVAFDFGYLRPAARKTRNTYVAQQRSRLKRKLQKRKNEALSAVGLMEESVRQKMKAERNIGGLCILQATYGVDAVRAIERSDKPVIHNAPDIIDVTIALAALVHHGQIFVSNSFSKVRRNSFW
jgi:hypothetical protein